MTDVQPTLSGGSQPDLFGPAPAPRADAYRVKPQHVLNRFAAFDAQLRAAEAWPWDAAQREDIRSRTWPYLLGKLREIGCNDEAAQWQATMSAHARRLDATAASAGDAVG